MQLFVPVDMETFASNAKNVLQQQQQHDFYNNRIFFYSAQKKNGQ